MTAKIRQFGIYYTSLFNAFNHKAFLSWVEDNDLNKEVVLEPFAGSNSIIEMLQEIELAENFVSYDIHPSHDQVARRDTIKDYPTGFRFCVTNPPWLYKPSAIRRGLAFPKTKHDDMYKLALELALDHNDYVAMLIPASFIRAEIFQNRLSHIIFINKKLFEHTDSPVCLALFSKDSTDDFSVYNGEEYLGEYSRLRALIPKRSDISVRFNDPDGQLGLVAIDNTKKPSIYFCMGHTLQSYDIKYSSRSITRISIADTVIKQSFINLLNDKVEEIREETNDIFFTTFKGLREDGKYRRRMDFDFAKRLIGACYE